MLGKVMKYEMRATGRLLLPFFGLALAAAVVLRIGYHIAAAISAPAGYVMESGLLVFGTLAAVAVFFLAVVAVVVRFYQSMVAGEAYLTFTLPVKPGTHIWGRAWVGLLYTTAACLLAIGIFLISAPTALAELGAQLANPSVTINNLDQSRTLPISGTGIGLIVGGTMFMLLFGLFVTLFQFYASMGLGTAISQNRVVGGILGFIILNTVESAVALPFIIVPTALSIGFREEEWTAYFDRWMNGTDAEVIQHTLVFVGVVLALVLVVNLIFTVAHYIITKRYFGPKLNLE